MQSLNLLVLLCMGHFLGDFGLQSDRMATEKCVGHGATLPWQWWLIAHAAIHGMIVALLTGIPVLGLAECAAHALIDYGKCKHYYRINLDQSLHLLCKLLWVLLLSARV